MIEMDGGIANNREFVARVLGEIILEYCRRCNCRGKASGEMCVPYLESFPWNFLIRDRVG